MGRVLNEQSIKDVIYGATLLGGGGGGSMENGMDLLTKYKELYPDKEVSVKLATYDEMPAGSYAAVTAGMGAPTAIKTVDFSKYAINTFESLQKMAKQMDPPRNLEYSLAVEMGGFNTFVPMLISLVNDIPLVDADGAGRAVPALDTLLLHINGCATSPLAMANDKNDQVQINLANPKDAALAEEIGRHICMSFNMMSGLSGWMLSGEEINSNIPTATVSLAEKVGAIIRECIEKGTLDKVYDVLNESGVVKARSICTGVASEVKTVQEDGFDRGYVVLTDSADASVSWKIDFQNENLIIFKQSGGQDVAAVTVPDIICMYNLEDGMPLTNADVKEGMRISLGLIKSNEKWWKNPNMFDVWRPFLDRVGYKGDMILFEDFKG